ncbi:MAG: neuraminidase-like domain-containing protein, partial [Polyangiaceae bacterium]
MLPRQAKLNDAVLAVHAVLDSIVEDTRPPEFIDQAMLRDALRGALDEVRAVGEGVTAEQRARAIDEDVDKLVTYIDDTTLADTLGTAEASDRREFVDALFAEMFATNGSVFSAFLVPDEPSNLESCATWCDSASLSGNENDAVQTWSARGGGTDMDGSVTQAEQPTLALEPLKGLRFGAATTGMTSATSFTDEATVLCVFTPNDAESYAVVRAGGVTLTNRVPDSNPGRAGYSSNAGWQTRADARTGTQMLTMRVSSAKGHLFVDGAPEEASAASGVSLSGTVLLGTDDSPTTAPTNLLGVVHAFGVFASTLTMTELAQAQGFAAAVTGNRDWRRNFVYRALTELRRRQRVAVEIPVALAGQWDVAVPTTAYLLETMASTTPSRTTLLADFAPSTIGGHVEPSAGVGDLTAPMSRFEKAAMLASTLGMTTHDVTWLMTRPSSSVWAVDTPSGAGIVALPPWLGYTCPTSGTSSRVGSSTVRTRYAANAPRAYSDDGILWGMLVEATATNLVNNQDISTWSAGGGGPADVTVITGPDRHHSGYEVTDDHGTDDEYRHYSNGTALASTVYTSSAWLQILGDGPITVSGSTNHIATNPVWLAGCQTGTSAESGWIYRHSSDPNIVEHTPVNHRVYPRPSTDDTGSMRVAFVQLEAGSYPTSFIGADGVNFTRAAATLGTSTSVVADGGHFDVTVTYRPQYANDEVAGDHNIVYVDDDNRLYFKESTDAFVLRLDGQDVITTGSWTFARDDELTVRVQHLATGSALTVEGPSTSEALTSPAASGITGDTIHFFGSPEVEEGVVLRSIAWSNVSRWPDLDALPTRRPTDDGDLPLARTQFQRLLHLLDMYAMTDHLVDGRQGAYDIATSGQSFAVSVHNALLGVGVVKLPEWLGILRPSHNATSQVGPATLASRLDPHAPRAYSSDGVLVGLLVEPAMTNLQPGYDLDTWDKAADPTINRVALPDGSSGNNEVVDSDALANYVYDNNAMGVAPASHTLSTWMQVIALSSGSWIVKVREAGVQDFATISVVGTDADWTYRTATWNGSSGTNPAEVHVNLANSSATGTCRATFFQVEERAYPTSFHPTTRSAETLSCPYAVFSPQGWFRFTLTYAPQYAHDEAANDHHVFYIDEDNRCYFDQSAATFVLRLGGTDMITSSAVTFSRLQHLTLTVQSRPDGVELVVSGATTGDSTTSAGAVAKLDVADDIDRVVLLGGPNGAEEGAVLYSIALAPLATGDELTTIHTVTAARSRWELADLIDLQQRMFPLGTAADYEHLTPLVKMLPGLEATRKLGVSVDTAARWVDGWEGDTFDEAMQVGREALAAAGAKYGLDRWYDVARPLRDRLREEQRDALVAHVMQDEGLASRDELYESLLLDVDMSPCALVSRISAGISSLQLFIHRALLGLESDIKLPKDAGIQWEWRKTFVLWEANRKVFLYPEDFIEPDLRIEKTPFFRELETDLRQGELTEELVEKAYMRYLRSLDQVARVNVLGVFHEQSAATATLPSVDNLHVYARAKGSSTGPLFYRRWVDRAYWTPWEAVDLDVDTNSITPLTWHGRHYIFMLKLTDPFDPTVGPNSVPQKLIARGSVVYSEREGNSWAGLQATREVELPALTRPRGALIVARPYIQTGDAELLLADMFASDSFQEITPNNWVTVPAAAFREHAVVPLGSCSGALETPEGSDPAETHVEPPSYGVETPTLSFHPGTNGYRVWDGRFTRLNSPNYLVLPLGKGAEFLIEEQVTAKVSFDTTNWLLSSSPVPDTLHTPARTAFVVEIPRAPTLFVT